MQFLDNKKSPPLAARQRGQAGEDLALAYLQNQGLRLVERNYRMPGRGGGEIDLVCLAPDGTLVFVEVRSRSRSDFGGAGASIGSSKRRRIVLAARHWLQRYRTPPACRFDVVLVQNAQVQWLQAAFDGAAGA